MKKLISFLVLSAVALGAMGCHIGEVSENDAQKFGQESEADRAAKASGQNQVDQGRQ